MKKDKKPPAHEGLLVDIWKVYQQLEKLLSMRRTPKKEVDKKRAEAAALCKGLSGMHIPEDKADWVLVQLAYIAGLFRRVYPGPVRRAIREISPQPCNWL